VPRFFPSSAGSRSYLPLLLQHRERDSIFSHYSRCLDFAFSSPCHCCATSRQVVSPSFFSTPWRSVFFPRRGTVFRRVTRLIKPCFVVSGPSLSAAFFRFFSPLSADVDVFRFPPIFGSLPKWTIPRLSLPSGVPLSFCFRRHIARQFLSPFFPPFPCRNPAAPPTDTSLLQPSAPSTKHFLPESQRSPFLTFFAVAFFRYIGFLDSLLSCFYTLSVVAECPPPTFSPPVLFPGLFFYMWSSEYLQCPG